MSHRVRVAVLVSGSGTNLQALLEAAARPDFPAEIAVVVSNRPGVAALGRAERAGVPAVVLPSKGQGRQAYDEALLAVLQAHRVEWVALAGFMRLLGHHVLQAFPWRVLNIHPSLLPAFPGLRAQEQALAWGARVTGATVHLVDEGTDTGPIVVQGAVPVRPEDDLPTLQARILRMEHRLYPLALRWAAEGRLQVEGRRVRLVPPPSEDPALFDLQIGGAQAT